MKWWARSSGSASTTVGEFFAQRLPDLLMQDLPAAFQQAFIGRVLHQRVFERVARGGKLAGSEDEFGFLQLRERGYQRRLVATDDRVQQQVGEVAPDRCADLGDFLYRREPVEAGHQRILKGRGDRERRHGAVEPVAFRHPR